MSSKKKIAIGARAKRGARSAAAPDERIRKPHGGGAGEWLCPLMESAYARMIPKAEAEAEEARVGAPVTKKVRGAKRAGRPFVSSYQQGLGEEVLSSVSSEHWVNTLQMYQSRKKTAALAAPVPGAPAVPGTNNWVPVGPSVIARGQTQNRAAISGRVARIAVATGGTRVYAATANGGVWRSDNEGLSWRSTMDGFDTDPSAFAAASLASGAVAIDLSDPDRVYVGTGEGDTDALFSRRLVNALPCYRGIGPIRSDDGGQTWVSEPSSPSLAGYAFFEIGVDPADGNHCIAATTNGLYERVLSGGSYQWVRRRTGNHSSVVVAHSGGVTRWFAAAWGGQVYTSTDGTSWSTVGTGFPTGISRIALAVQPDNPNVLYALIATATFNALHSVRRLDGAAGSWKNISGAPTVLPLDTSGYSQGDYDLCITVDPNNANLIYMGGSYYDDGTVYPASIWRASVSASGSAYAMTATSIGGNAHADVHVLTHSPGDSNRLWAGTDGGVFVHTNPTGAGGFESRNTGLATLCTNYIAQHPTEPAVLYTGLQDNGSAKGTGEMVWRHVLFGDGGYCVVNWSDPFRLLLYANGNVYRASDGALDYSSWANITPAGSDWAAMAEPLVGAPYHPASPADAEIVALAAGTYAGTTLTAKVYISANFGTTWANIVSLPAGSGTIYSMIFASPTRLFVGTSNGRVFRLDQSGGTWSATRIDNVAAGTLGVAAMVADIAVDWSDATRNSIYLCLGGVGDYRHVWRFNGTAWQARSGAAGSATSLLDVEHNAIQYDSVTSTVYVGADIGVWFSSDGGVTWHLMQSGLPDAPVFDLQIHPTLRLLRASLHGRGLYEWKLDAPAQGDVDLYTRDTMLDTGRGTNTDGRNDPSIFPTAPVVHYLSPNIKVDVPTAAGYQTPTTSIDFFTFNERIVDGSNGVATNVPPPTVHNRVYVEVHNRGRVDATDVQVMAVITNASAGLGLLPMGFTANVVAGTPVPGSDWTTLGVKHVTNLRAGCPQVVSFDLPSTVLPLPASLPGQSHYCLLMFLHSTQDPFTNTERNVDLLTLSDRKVGQHNLHIVEFVGTPPPGTGTGMWAMLNINGAWERKAALIDLHIDSRRFPGTIQVVVPPPFAPANPKEQAKEFRVGSLKSVGTWIDQHLPASRRLFMEAKYTETQYKALVTAMQAVRRGSPLVLQSGSAGALRGLKMNPGERRTVFLRIDPPRDAKVGSMWEFDVQQRDTENGRLLGGSRYRVVINRPTKK